MRSDDWIAGLFVASLGIGVLYLLGKNQELESRVGQLEGKVARLERWIREVEAKVIDFQYSYERDKAELMARYNEIMRQIREVQKFAQGDPELQSKVNEWLVAVHTTYQSKLSTYSHYM